MPTNAIACARPSATTHMKRASGRNDRCAATGTSIPKPAMTVGIREDGGRGVGGQTARVELGNVVRQHLAIDARSAKRRAIRADAEADEGLHTACVRHDAELEGEVAAEATCVGAAVLPQP